MRKGPFEHIITLFTPAQCYICRSEETELCYACFETISHDLESRCYKCNKLTKSNKICHSCRSSSRLRRVWWLGVYKDDMKLLIRAMKYNRQRALARVFGDYLAQTLPHLPEDTLVVPAPTASARVRQRGFDQAYLIAAQFASNRQLPFKPLLYRTSQVDLIGKSRVQRTTLMAKSLAVQHTAEVRGATILLIDDVLTTGSTLEAGATLLRDHGAKHIDGAVLARNLLN